MPTVEDTTTAFESSTTTATTFLVADTEPPANLEFRSPRLTYNEGDDDDGDSWGKGQNLFAVTEKSITDRPLTVSPTEVVKGGYHEINPGQYHETNPGQYDELHPGQYHETNPGQYHEVNPGQYHEVNPGQPVPTTLPAHGSDLDVQVDVVKNTDDEKIYNVQSRVDEFIIGEYGTISKSNGQTQNGVRYTAVADADSGVDPEFIYETLVKYFPMAVKGLQSDDDDDEEEERPSLR